MKRTIAAALTLLALTTGATFAQRGYQYPNDNRGQYDNNRGRYDNDNRGRHDHDDRGRYDNDNRGSRYERDEIQEEIKIDRIDAIVGLSNRQERQLHKIEDNYDRMMSASRMTSENRRQLQLRKRQDMLAVLTSAQRDRLFSAQQQQQQYGRRPYSGYGRRG